MSYPEYLTIANTLRERLSLAGERDSFAAINDAIAELETLVREPPNMSPMIDAGPLDEYPATKAVVSTMENVSHRGDDQGIYAIAALSGVGALISGLKLVEMLVQGLAARVANLETD